MSDTRKNEPVSHSWFRFRLHCLSNENYKKERCLLIVSTKAEHVKMADVEEVVPEKKVRDRRTVGYGMECKAIQRLIAE